MDFREWLKNLIEFVQNNQLMMTALGLGGAGTIIVWLKEIPVGIYNLLKREFTTEMTVTNQHIIFYDILKLVKTTYINKNFRRLKILNGRYGEDETILSMGYGSHFFFYKGRPMWISLTKEEGNQTAQEKDTMTFIKLGRNHEIFKTLVTDAENLRDDKNTNKIYKMGSYWEFIKDQVKRELKSVFIEKRKQDILINTLDKFISSEEWYLNKGIPYQLGILLYGPPGTGKTSLIKAIASYLSYSIYYLPTAALGKIETAAANLPDKCIMIIEDIDSNPVTKTRDKDDDEDEDGMSGMLQAMEKIGLSEVLNALDGLFSSHGRILIATTNHIEDLDLALIRPGRIDLKVEIGFVNKEILTLFFQSFFPEIVFRTDVNIKSGITIAYLQNLVLQGLNAEEILNTISE